MASVSSGNWWFDNLGSGGSSSANATAGYIKSQLEHYYKLMEVAKVLFAETSSGQYKPFTLSSKPYSSLWADVARQTEVAEYNPHPEIDGYWE